jgi:hypothetical protein
MDWGETMPIAALAVLLLCLCLRTAAGADAQVIYGLRQQEERLQQRRDSLAVQRDSLVASAEALSARIDSLKDAAREEEAGRLQVALRASLALVRRLVDTDRGLELARLHQEQLREQLRVAYDWEIGQLIQQLDRQPDQGLLAQLMVYQQERERLGLEPVAGQLQYGAEMAISPSDGPDEIRQKMEMMEGIAARMKAEQRRTRTQLARLEEEQRLRTRVRIFASEMTLFDDHLLEGRVLVRTAGLAPAGNGGDYSGAGETRGDGGPGLTPVTDGSPSAAATTVSPALEAARDGEPRGLALGGAEDVALEIQKLRAHQQEVRQLEAVAQERAARFRACLDEMLEGSD